MPEYIINFSIIALVAICGALLWEFFRERRSLEFFVHETDSVLREGETVKFYNCWITNTGNQDLQSITLKIELNGGVIDSVKFINSDFLRLNGQGDAFIDATVPVLSPNEKVGALISIQNPEGDSPLRIDARAGDVVASERVLSPDEVFMPWWRY